MLRPLQIGSLADSSSAQVGPAANVTKRFQGNTPTRSLLICMETVEILSRMHRVFHLSGLNDFKVEAL